MRTCIQLLALSAALCVAAITAGCKNRAADTAAPVSQTSGMENGHEWADLGLSVRWAACNVGAVSPEEYGDLIAWGETEPKSAYDWNNLKYCHVSNSISFSKYITDVQQDDAFPENDSEELYFEPLPVMLAPDSNGFIMIQDAASRSDADSRSVIVYGITENAFETDDRTVLEPSDDAASVNWGGSWRMPTDAEWMELLKNCSWTWTVQNGVNGHKVTSRINGNSIFLPAAGHHDDFLHIHPGYEDSFGYYWSSSLDSTFPEHAMMTLIGRRGASTGTAERYMGLSVRPVCE